MAGPFVAPETPAASAPAPQAPPVYSPEAGKVAIRDADGSTWKIAAGDLDAAMREGARPATEAEYYGTSSGLGGQASEALFGGARGLSAGFFDPLAIEGARQLGGDAAAEDVRRGLNMSREAFPGTSAAAELAGAAAPMFFGAGAAEAGVQAESMLGRAAARAGQALPRAFGEGMVYGVGGKASEDALAGHPFVAESYATAALEGGVLGGVLGVGTAAGLGALADRFAPRFGKSVQAATREERALVRAADREPSSIMRFAEEQADLAAYRAAGAGKPDFRRLGRTAEEQTERAATLGRRVQDIAEKQGESFATMSQAKIAKMVAKETNEVGAELGRMRKMLDEKAFERPSVRSIAERFENEIKPALAERFPLTAAEETKRAEELLARLAKQGDNDGKIGFEALFNSRKSLDGMVNYERVAGAAPVQGEEGIKLLRNIVEDEFVRAAETGSKQVGSEFANKYNLAKEAYGDLAALKAMTAKKAAGDAAGSTFQLKDLMLGAVGAAAGGPAAMLAPVAGKLAREYGNQVTAHALSKLTKLRSAASAADEMDKLLQRGAKELFEGGKGAARTEKSITSGEVRQIRAQLSTPEGIEARVQAALGDLPKHAPRLAASVATTLTRAAVHLRDSMPKDPVPGGAPLQMRPPPPIPQSELRKAAATIEVLDDPTVVFDRMKQGRLTDAHVRALEAGHPETYQRMQNYIRTHAEELRRKLSVQEELRLSVLFRVPINESLKPQNVSAFQQVFLPPEPTKDKGVGSNVANISPAAGGTRATAWDEQEKDL